MKWLTVVCCVDWCWRPGWLLGAPGCRVLLRLLVLAAPRQTDQAAAPNALG
jgi:hypothetical protein